MWNNTRDLINNSLNNFSRVLRMQNGNTNDLNQPNQNTRRSRNNRQSNRSNRSSTRSNLNSQFTRESINNTTSNVSNLINIRPPHIHSRTRFHSLSSQPTSTQHTCFNSLPTDTNAVTPSLTNNNLSPILPVVNARYQINNYSPLVNTNVFSQGYLRSISRNFCSLTEDSPQNLLHITKEKNYLSILMSLLVIITIVIAILQPKWFSINGGICNNKFIGLQEFMYLQNSEISNIPNNNIKFNQKFIRSISIDKNDFFKDNQKLNSLNDTKLEKNFEKNDQLKKINETELFLKRQNLTSFMNYISQNNALNQNDTKKIFFDKIKNQHFNNLKAINSINNFETMKKLSSEDSSQSYPYRKNNFNQRKMIECLSPDVLSLQRLIIILCFFVIFTSLIHLVLELISTKNKYMNLLREHAIFNIISIIICIMIIGISYLLSNLLTKEQIHKHRSINPLYLDKNNFNDYDKPIIEVRLEISYYLIIFSGIFSLIAAFCNLFNKPNLYLINLNSDQETSNLLDESQANGYWSHLFNANNPNLRNLVSSYYLPPPPYSP